MYNQMTKYRISNSNASSRLENKIKYITDTKTVRTVLTAGLLGLMSCTYAYAAGDGHNHSHDGAANTHSNHSTHSTNNKDQSNHSQHDMTPSPGMFLKKKIIDGYTVSFHVMEASDGMRHGGSHNFMIKVEKGGVVVKDAVINSKVIHPDKRAESKMLMKMGDWYMSGYDLAHKGKYQMMVLFKTSDGKKHQGGVYYAQ
ncbi:MAG: hypothetical protein OEX07_07435 [Gammaproteobacteria bacterium]|nr:hypothetical protein [Gammaproteobacteria bacterium]